jgi:hypothetical protein
MGIDVYKSLSLLCLFSLLTHFNLSAQCTLACNGQLNVSLNASCQAEITYDLVLENPDNCIPGGPDNFQVDVYNTFGAFILPGSPFVTTNELDDLLPVRVTHLPSGNNCWGSVLIQDYLAPQITCPPDVVVSCAGSTDPDDVGHPYVQDCSTYILNSVEVYTDLGCNDPQAEIVRTWIASDIKGNTSSCSQTIGIALPTVANVTFPPSLDNIEAPALECPNPDTDPAETGAPTINGNPIPVNGDCALSVFYDDLEIPLCGSTYSIVRTWTVVEWCTGVLVNDTQIIWVDDSQGPVIDCPDTLTVGAADPTSCSTPVALPALNFTDNCSNPDLVTFTIISPFGMVQGNGGILFDVPIGTHEITYSAKDECNNITNCPVTLVVEDNMPPTVICDQFGIVTLGPAGTAVVPADIFDDGSYDNCCLDDFRIRRLSPACDSPSGFEPTITFCCEDIGAPVEVEIQVSDCFGNVNFCTVFATITDKLDPTITCPAPVTVECTENTDDLVITGIPFVFDGCGVDTTFYSDLSLLDDCGVGLIQRTWTVVDAYDNEASCQQVITVEDNTPVQVTFPEDYTLNGCLDVSELDPENLPAPFNYPVITGDDCEQAGTGYSDQVFYTAPDACVKVVRTWQVINWCEYVPNSGNQDGVFEAVQTLKILDVEAPVLTCPDNLEVAILGNDCVTTVNLPQPDAEDCSGITDVTAQGDLGAGFGPFTDVEAGSYSVWYEVTDGCGNSSSCSITVSVSDQKLPTAYCIEDLVIGLMPVDSDNDGTPDAGMIEVNASVLDAGSFDNCPGELLFSFSPNPADSLMLFDCDDIGENEVEIWVTDAAGNQDFCVTALIIQDNQFHCNGGVPPMISGQIATESGEGVMEAMVMLNDVANTMVFTDEDGMYAFDNLEFGEDYTLTPEKTDDLLNGVTTWDLAIMRRHILGIELFTSPYQFIAADADKSGTISTVDILNFQKLIIYVEDELPAGNTSWRFVDGNYEFQNPDNPLDEVFPEVISVNNLAENLTDAHFMAIKVGDLNQSVDVNGWLDTEDRNLLPVLGLALPDVVPAVSEALRIPVRSAAEQSLGGLQMTIDLGENLKQVTIVPVHSDFQNLAWSFKDQQLHISWYQAEELHLAAGEELFQILGQSTAAAPLQESLRLLSTREGSQAFSYDTGELRIDWEWIDAPIQLEAFPNPFSSATTISWHQQNAGTVQLQVFDLSGKQWIAVERRAEEGPQQYELRGDQLPTAGVYLYVLKLEDGNVQTGKVVLER